MLVPDVLVTCLVVDCDSDPVARGLCRKHYGRWRRTGSTDLRRSMDPDSYEAVHKRLVAQRGSAVALACSVRGCTSPSTGWAWLRTGPSLSGESKGKSVSWGTDITDYAPMCASHSRLLDHGGSLTVYPCGHPRSEENTQTVKRSTSTARECRTCRNDYQKMRRASAVGGQA